jgi:DNA end-binding protein Ku
MALKLVDSLHGEFRPEAFEDGYRARVLALIETKARGEEPELPRVEAAADAPDLMAALEASLTESASPRRRSSPPARKGARSGRKGAARSRS